MKAKTKMLRSAFMIGFLVSVSSGFPALEENAPYCIYWKNKKIELPLRKRGNIHVVAGDNIVFQFGKWTDANKTEYEAHYLVELDPVKKSFSSDTSGKHHQPVYYSMISLRGSTAKELPHVKIKGTKVTDSTWVINEWFSPQYENMFGTMPYKLRKKDKREKEGYKWLCKEVAEP